MKDIIIKTSGNHFYIIKKQYILFVSILFIFVGVYLFLYALHLKEEEFSDYTIETTIFPELLFFERGYCLKDTLVENENGELRKIKVGTICDYIEYGEFAYVNVNNETWKIIDGQFVYLLPILKYKETPIIVNNKELQTKVANKKEIKNEQQSIIEENKESEEYNNIINENNDNNYFKPGDVIGTIICENVSLNAQVVYGETQYIIDNYDICISIPPGSGKPMFCGGHSTKSLSVLNQVKENDIITIETNYGIYTYKVTKVAIGKVLISNFGENDFLKDIKTGEELFTKQGNEILQIYTCAYLDTGEEGPTKYRYAVIAELLSQEQK